MKAFIAAGFALITSLSGLAHAAGFNDSSPIIDITPIRMGRQDLSHVRVVNGFNQQSHHAEATVQSASPAVHSAVATGANCALAPRFGFNDSASFASC